MGLINDLSNILGYMTIIIEKNKLMSLSQQQTNRKSNLNNDNILDTIK